MTTALYSNEKFTMWYAFTFTFFKFYKVFYVIVMMISTGKEDIALASNLSRFPTFPNFTGK